MLKSKYFYLLLVIFLSSKLFSQTAEFTANKTIGCAPLIVGFSDASTGAGISQWFWDFGNGNTSSLKNPSATYSTPGTYTVKLTIRNSSGTDLDVETKTAFITVNAPPTASFITTDSIGCFPLAVNFTDLSVKGTGNITGWTWDFGDGNNSTSQNPSHTYASPGNYNVILIVTDANGCNNVLTKPAYIKVSASTLTPAFTPSPIIGCNAPTTVTFNNTTTGTGTLSYSWDFGDGNTSTSTNPSNTFNTAGAYTVKLDVTSSIGCKKTITSTYNVLGGSTVDFNSTPAGGVCPGGTFSFTDATVPTPASWAWNFGDGGTSTSQNPTHTYAIAGTYNVKLKTTISGICVDSIIKTVTVNPKPIVTFTADSTKACSLPFAVNFTDQTAGAAGWQWSFGDGGTSTAQNPSHSYTQSGKYTVKLIVTTASGCIDSLSKVNYIDITLPIANITALPNEGCVPLPVAFLNSSSSAQPVTNWNWNFGDATTSTAQNPPIHTYSAVGIYTVTLNFTNSYGCSSNTSTIVTVTNPPVPNFSATPTNLCAKNAVNFTDLTTGTVTSWEWNFGDGQTSSLQNPVHFFSDTGTFTVRLISKNVGCPDTITFPNLITIKTGVPVFTVGALNCSNVLGRSFTSASRGADSLIWNFGDGSPVNADLAANNTNVNHNFTAAGNYTVRLTVKNNTSGCRTDTTTIVNIVDLVPDFTSAPTGGCTPVTVAFNSTTTGGTPSNYLWSYGDGTTNNTSSGSHTYVNKGKYTVKLFVTDIYNCIDSAVKTNIVNVYDITPDFSIAAQTGCDSLKVDFSDISVVSPAATSWLWNFGDATSSSNTSNAQNPTHYYKNTGTYTVTLSVTNAEGTCTTTKNNFVTFTLPTAAFTADSTNACPTTTVDFTNQSTNATTYAWTLGNGNNPTTPNASTQYANGTYTVTLVATDAKGCTSSEIKNNYITVDVPIVGFSVTPSIATCPPLNAVFTDTTKFVLPIATWNWSFGDGSSSTNTSPTKIYTAPGVYDVKLIVTNSAGCKDSVTKVGYVQVNGPSGTYSFTPSSGCIPLAVAFTSTAVNTVKYIWDYGDGNIGPNAPNANHIYTTLGTKQPFLTLEDASGCQYTIPNPATVNINGFPNSNFTYTPALPKKGTAITFVDASLSGTVWDWDFDDGTTSSSQNNIHTYNTSGKYDIKLKVSNGVCSDSITKTITVIEDLVEPNIFSPNGDGVNETFNLGAYGIKEIKIIIFDRWGVEVYSKTAERIFWDGRNKSGAEMPAGTYYYIADATSLSGEVTKLKGFVQLAR